MLRVVLIILTLFMLSTSTVAFAMPTQWPMISFPSDIMGNEPLYNFYPRTVSGYTSPAPLADLFPQPYTTPGEYVEYTYPPSMVSLLTSGTSGDFIKNAIANNTHPNSIRQLVGAVPMTGTNGIPLMQSLNFVPSNPGISSTLPLYKGPFGS